MTDNKPLLLNLRETANRLNIGKTTLYQMIQSGRFSPKLYRIGKKVLVNAAELTDWVNSGMPLRREWIWKGRTDEC